jgi:predicted esterase
MAFFSSGGNPYAGEWESVEFAESPSVIEPAVTYLSRAPRIDGTLDEELGSLPVRRFSVMHKSTGDNPDTEAVYRLAYGTEFLYVYIEAEAEKLSYRDRAYQNGDGFTVVLTVPKPDNAPSREFYVLACSAVDRRAMEWTRKIFWYYNVDNIFLGVSDDMEMEFKEGDGTIHFELLLPWKDVHPYHPWLSDGIGFNLGMTRAVGEKEKNVYRVVDAGIGSENEPREYALLRFEEPVHEGGPQSFVIPERNNFSAGERVLARAVTVASKPVTERIKVLIKSGEMSLLGYEIANMECDPGLNFKDFPVDIDRLPDGGYLLEWSSRIGGSKGETGLSILPPFSTEELNRRLDRIEGVLSEGSLSTLRFTIEEIAMEMGEIYPYETGTSIRIKLSRLLGSIERAERGEDAVAGLRGFVRMAYLSELDDTYQPYVVWIPENFDASSKYPLLVYLHGSASTERDIVGRSIPEGFIALGPKGRGPSNWYSWDNAQTDIAEAIRAVQRNFPIDERNIILTGFSMGGYGVYRTFYETPETYRAIAVFSGIPRVRFGAPEGARLIDFNEPGYLEPFADTPAFIFHGKRDLNVPYEETAQFISSLENAGARVEFHTEEDKGHEAPSAETMEAFVEWINSVLDE